MPMMQGGPQPGLMTDPSAQPDSASMPPPSGPTGDPAAAAAMAGGPPGAQGDALAQDPVVSTMVTNIKALQPDQQNIIKQYLTPEFAAIVGMMFGPQVGVILNQFANKDMTLQPVPKAAMDHIGREKFSNFIGKALQGAGQAGGLMAPQQGQVPAGGPQAAPQGPQSSPSVPNMAGGI